MGGERDQGLEDHLGGSYKTQGETCQSLELRQGNEVGEEENECKGWHIAEFEPMDKDNVILRLRKSQGLKMKPLPRVSSCIWWCFFTGINNHRRRRSVGC